MAYVGITRAEETLTIIVAKKRHKYGEMIDSVPSRFLEEMPQEDLEWEEDQIPLSDDEKREQGKDKMAEMRKRLMS